MKSDYTKNLTAEMLNRQMSKVPSGSIVCQSSQSREVEGLLADYNAFIKLLDEQCDHDPVPLAEFAIWRSEEAAEYGYEQNPIPSIH